MTPITAYIIGVLMGISTGVVGLLTIATFLYMNEREKEKIT